MRICEMRRLIYALLALGWALYARFRPRLYYVAAVQQRKPLI